MSHDQFEVFSNQAVAACAVVYFLTFLAHVWAWVQRPQALGVAASGASARADASAVVGGVAVADPPKTVEDGVGTGAADASRFELWTRIAFSLTVVAAALHLLALVTRGLAADPVRVPWTNMYEFTLTATFVVVALFLATYRRLRLEWLGPVVSGFVLVVLMIDVLVLYEPVTPLRDALQSPWLVIHVIAAITATGAFTIGGMVSLLYLLKERSESRHEGVARGYLASVPSLVSLDKMAYRWHAFAFPVWTFAALIAGPIWAEYAWGRYWGWDPKEVWAFITWVAYAAYLHARATAGWKGRRAAVVALVGLATLWFNFVGINFFFGSGSQHSYAGELVVRTLSGG